jgi:hypothetical protein
LHRTHHHLPGGPEWIISIHDPDASREEWAAVLSQLGETFSRTGAVMIADRRVEVPARVRLDLRHERTPAGDLALMVRAEWPRDIPDAPAVIPLDEFTVGPIDQAATTVNDAADA